MLTTIIIIVLFILIIQISGLKTSNKELKQRLSKLEANIIGNNAQGKNLEIKKPEVFASKNPIVTRATEKSKEIPQPVKSHKEETPLTKSNNPLLEQKATTNAPIIPKVTNQFWSKLENQFVENWTGILGSVIMVIGVAFLGIYAALKLSAIYRFFMLSGFALALFGGFMYFRPKQKWIQFGLWLRSSAAAIFLFACLGSGGIDGLQWIDDPTKALGLLLLGIAINLFLSWIGGNQVFASLHLLLSLSALSVAPQGQITLIVATAVGLVGVLITYREKWDYHLLMSISLFFVYHIYWYFQVESRALSFAANLTGIICVLIISLTTAFVHYREVYKTKTFEMLPFSVHLINWFYFGIGLMMHSTGSKWKSILLVVGAIGAYLLARKAKKMEIRWLYHTDTLIAQAIALITVISLSKWGLDNFSILIMMFVQSLIFLVVIAKEKEEGLYRIGAVVMNLIALAIILYALPLINIREQSVSVLNASLMGIAVLSGTAFHLFTLKQKNVSFTLLDNIFDKKNTYRLSIIGSIIGCFIVMMHMQLYQLQWIEYGIAGIICFFLYLHYKVQSKSLLISFVFMVLGAHLLNWHFLFSHKDTSVSFLLLHSLPLFSISILSLKWDYIKNLDKHIKWFGIYLFAIHLFIISYFIFTPISPLIFGILALILSILCFELSTWISNKYKDVLIVIGEPDRYLLHVAYTGIIIFLARHIFVHLQLEDYIGIFKIRMLIEVLAIGVFSYIAFIKKPDSISKYVSWNVIHPLIIELIIIFYTFTIALEVSGFWQPMIWIGNAFLFMIIGNRYPVLSRLKLYGIIYYWATVLQVAFLTSSHVSPSTDWLDQAWLSGIIAILLSFGFLVTYYKYFDLNNTAFPATLKIFESLSSSISKNRNGFFLYPLIFCVGIFLFWSFDKSILTLLWVTECLAIFVVSLILKEQQFRYVALIGLGVCVIRLVFFDLSQSGTLTKAMVFLGVGVIMLFMNFLYNKYKNRFLDA